MCEEIIFTMNFLFSDSARNFGEFLKGVGLIGIFISSLLFWIKLWKKKKKWSWLNSKALKIKYCLIRILRSRKFSILLTRARMALKETFCRISIKCSQILRMKLTMMAIQLSQYSYQLNMEMDCLTFFKLWKREFQNHSLLTTH